MRDYDSITVELDGSQYQVFGWGVYPRHSVLAGQTMRVRLECYDTIDEALIEYPTAQYTELRTLKPNTSMSPCPPNWYDKGDAGEDW